MKELNSAQFYRLHGQLSDPQGGAEAFDAVPSVLPAITSTVQGVLIHDYFGAQLYSDPPSNIADASRATLPISERLPTIHGFGDIPLTERRPPSSRTVGTCRDFALLTCALLRHHGIAARVRCGFARYFHPPTYEDHWICEYWCAVSNTWKRADAQLDEEHRRHLSLTFDVNDMPKDAFCFPWQVWEHFGHDQTRLQDFGHGDAKGFWFLRVNLARDFLALTKHEVSAWDQWRDHSAAETDLNSEMIAECDETAAAAKLLDTAETFDIASLDGLISRLQRPRWRG